MRTATMRLPCPGSRPGTGWHNNAIACRRSSASRSPRIAPSAAAASSRARECGSQPLHEVAGQPFERRIAGVQGGGEPAFGPEEFDEPVDPERQRPRRWVGGAQLGAGGGDGVDPGPHHGLDQVRALGEVPVQRADADSGEVGDLLGRGVHAGGVEDRPRRLDQGLDVALGVGAPPRVTWVAWVSGRTGITVSPYAARRDDVRDVVRQSRSGRLRPA